MRESRYVLWVSNDREREEKKQRAVRGRNVEGEVLRQNEKTQGAEKCDRVLQGNKRQCDFKEACGC